MTSSSRAQATESCARAGSLQFAINVSISKPIRSRSFRRTDNSPCMSAICRVRFRVQSSTHTASGSSNVQEWVSIACRNWLAVISMTVLLAVPARKANLQVLFEELVRSTPAGGAPVGFGLPQLDAANLSRSEEHTSE